MKAVVQRVKHAKLVVDNELIAEIGKGLVVFVGFKEGCEDENLDWIVNKISGLRIFEDENEKMNLGLDAVGGEVLVVSQFTLFGNCRKGRRPSFAEAAGPELGNALYEKFLAICEELGYPPQHGRFGAHMEVESINDGPVTLILDTDELMNEPRRK